MTLLAAILLFVAGLLSGAINAVAGGGTFLTFGAMTLFGVPPIAANATSSIVQFPGYITSALAYRREIAREWKPILILSAISLVGSLGGALSALARQPVFQAVVPWLCSRRLPSLQGPSFGQRWSRSIRRTRRRALPRNSSSRSMAGFSGLAWAS